MEITAANFKRAYDQVTVNESQAILAAWSSQPAYTRLARTLIMPSVAACLDLVTIDEYNRIDVVFVKKFIAADGLYHQPIQVAVELENNITGTEREIVKLSSLDCPLKVLITFATPQRIRTALTSFAEIAALDPTKTDGKMLVIFGPYGMRPPTALSWTYFLFSNNSFLNI